MRRGSWQAWLPPCKVQLVNTLGARPADGRAVAIAHEAARLLVHSRRQMKANDAACKEMEGAAVGWACQLHGTPFFCIKAVTDIVDGTRWAAGDRPRCDAVRASHSPRASSPSVLAGPRTRSSWRTWARLPRRSRRPWWRWSASWAARPSGRSSWPMGTCNWQCFIGPVTGTGDERKQEDASV